MNDSPTWPYKLLQRQEHLRLVENIGWVTKTAGVPPDYIDQSMAELGCSKNEVEWVRNYPTLNTTKFKGGMILLGPFNPTPEIRMMAMGAAFLRHYIDARIVSLDLLIKLADDEDGFNPTVLLIPNFYRESHNGATGVQPWQLRQVYSLLVERFSTRRATIMHVDDEKKLISEYGSSFHDFLWSNWSVLKAP